MQILHYQPSMKLSQGGVTRAVIDMAQLLAERGHGVTVLTGSDAEIPAEWRNGTDDRPRVVEMPRHGVAGLRFARRQRPELAALFDQADVVHLHGMWIASGVQLAAYAAQSGKPVVFTPHGMLDEWSMSQRRLKKRILMPLHFSKILRLAKTIHCTAEEELRQAARYFDREKGVVVPCVVDLGPYQQLPDQLSARSGLGLDDDAPLILFLSRIHPVKRLELIIDAIAQRRSAGDVTRLFIAGTGEPAYVESLAARVRSAGLADRVRFLGHVDGEQKVAAYCAADLMVLPSIHENFGLANIESLACGTPIVTTQGVQIWRDLESSGAATIVEPTVPAVSQAVAEALSDRPTLRQRGEAGRRFVFDWLNPDAVAERYLAVYRAAESNPPTA